MGSRRSERGTRTINHGLILIMPAERFNECSTLTFSNFSLLVNLQKPLIHSSDSDVYALSEVTNGASDITNASVKGAG
jgi:hypothetical protein